MTQILQAHLVFEALLFLGMWCSVKIKRKTSPLGSFTNPFKNQSEALDSYASSGVARMQHRWYITNYGLGRLTRLGEPRRDAFFVPVPVSIRHLGKVCAIPICGVIAPVLLGLVGAVIATTSISCVVCFALCELHFRRWTWHLGAETTGAMIKLERACILSLTSPVTLPLATVKCSLHICKWTGARIARARWYKCTRVATVPLCAALFFAAYSGWIGTKMVGLAIVVNAVVLLIWMMYAFNLRCSDAARHLLHLCRKIGGRWGHVYVAYALISRAKKLHRTEQVTRRVPLSGFRPGMARLFGAIACVVSTVMIRATRQAEIDVATSLGDGSGWLLLFVGVAFIVILGRMKFF